MHGTNTVLDGVIYAATEESISTAGLTPMEERLVGLAANIVRARVCKPYEKRFQAEARPNKTSMLRSQGSKWALHLGTLQNRGLDKFFWNAGEQNTNSWTRS